MDNVTPRSGDNSQGSENATQLCQGFFIAYPVVGRGQVLHTLILITPWGRYC